MQQPVETDTETDSQTLGGGRGILESRRWRESSSEKWINQNLRIYQKKKSKKNTNFKSNFNV